MAQVTGDRIAVTSTTTGTGTYTVATSGISSAYLAISTALRADGTAIQVGDTFWYKATDVDGSYNDTGSYEIGLGTYASTSTFSRTTIIASSNAGAAVSWAAGTRLISITAVASKTLQVTSELCTILPNTGTEPAASEAGTLKLYARTLAGEIMPRYKNPDGEDHYIQQIIALNGYASCRPGSGTTPSVQATVLTNGGTVSHPSPATTNLSTQIRKSLYTSSTTAATLASQIQVTPMCYRGLGFRFVLRFSHGTLQSGNRTFFGLCDATTALANQDWTTATANNKIGIAINANTGNLNLVYNTAAASPTVVALGANFPVDTTSVYDLIVRCAAGGANLMYEVINRSTGNTTGSQTITTNLPSSTAFMAPYLWMCNNATAASVAFGLHQWTLESDF